jgi:hypothetical protein
MITQEQRKEAMQIWLKDTTELRECRMPGNAKFFVGQRVIWKDTCYEVLGFYCYNDGQWPAYLMLEIYGGQHTNHLSGIPISNQFDMYLESEKSKHQRQYNISNQGKVYADVVVNNHQHKAKIINMFDYFPRNKK